jgi:hypothetical protein
MRLRKLAATLALCTLLPAACGPSTTGKSGGGSTGDPITIVDPGGKPGGNNVVMVKRTAVEPKTIDATVKKGLAYLAKHQLKGGGWGQGDESVHMGNSMANMADSANVADTSMALLAFLRSGNTASKGDYQDEVQRGIAYVVGEIEKSDDDSLFVTSVRGTRVQGKIGQYVDTFSAMMMLTEAQGTMRDGVANAKIDAALKKVVRKVEKNQRDNGSWDDNGWAPVLSQAIAAKGLNRAAQNGVAVSPAVLDRVEKQANQGDMAARGSAGVGLYGSAASSAGARDSYETKKAKVETLKAKKKKYRPDPLNQSPDEPTDAEIAAAEADADRSFKAAVETERAMISRLDDSGFIAGFGNNGGEEFLSYLLISETLVQKGGDEWQRWDAAISKLVGKVQNEDGSWSGHHCITGRTFCTAAALLVLMGDRTPATTAVIAK